MSRRKHKEGYNEAIKMIVWVIALPIALTVWLSKKGTPASTLAIALIWLLVLVLIIAMV